MRGPRGPWAVLGLAPGADPERIRAAYRRLAKAWHPDKFTGDPALQASATARMKAINAAYAALRSVPAGPTSESPAGARTAPRGRPRTFDPMEGRPYRSGHPADLRIPEWRWQPWFALVILVLVLTRGC